MVSTSLLNISLIDTALSSKEIQHNRGVRDLEIMCGSYIINILATPPPSPNKGDIYAVASTGATGDWLGFENNLAVYNINSWDFKPLVTGVKFVNLADNFLYYFNGTSLIKVFDSPFIVNSSATVFGKLYEIYGLDTTTVFNLPEGDFDGDRFSLSDYSGTFDTSNLTVNCTGNDLIYDGIGLTPQIILNAEYEALEFIFAKGVWRLLRTATPSGSAFNPQALTNINSNVVIDLDNGDDKDIGDSVGNGWASFNRSLQILNTLDLGIRDYIINVVGSSEFRESSIVLGNYKTNGGRAVIEWFNAEQEFTNTVANNPHGVIRITGGSIWEIRQMNINALNSAENSTLISIEDGSTLILSSALRVNRSSNAVNIFNVINGTLIFTSNCNTFLNDTPSTGAWGSFIKANNGKVVIGTTASNTSITFQSTCNFEDYITLVNSTADIYATYTNAPPISGSQYNLSGLSLLQRNNDPNGSATNTIETKSYLL